MLALVLLLGGLLGAALAGQLTKADGEAPAPVVAAPSVGAAGASGGTGDARIVTWTSRAAVPTGAMIGQDVPADRQVRGSTTEVKDA